MVNERRHSNGIRTVTLAWMRRACVVALGALVACGGPTQPSAGRLTFTVQPSNTVAGVSITPALQVMALETSGNTAMEFTGTVVVALGANPSGGTLSGTTSVAAVKGVASFVNLGLDKAGTGYTLTAATTGLSGATSAAFNLTPGAAVKLVFTRPPTNTAAEAVITPALQVTAQDGFGNTATGFTGMVTVALGVNPSGGTLSGTTHVAAANGVVSFADLTIDRPGTGYTLVATATSLTGSTSVAFDIRPVFALLSAGNIHTCGVSPAGAAYCWGYNGDGELGNGTTTSSATPVAVAGGLTFAAVSAGDAVDAGGQHTCGVTRAGAAYCWGYNGFGGLGNGTTTNSTTPVAVSGGLTFAAVSAGGGHTCGVTPTGAAYCWGYNIYGQLGDSTTTNSTTPVAVSGGLAFAAIDAGKNVHTCGVTPKGAAYCWGYNSVGELGNGTTTNSATPVAVSGGLTFATVSGGADHTCGVTPAGAAYCWGYNGDGELGNGTTGGTATPVAVSGGLVFAAVSTGGFAACGVTTAGAGYCWGWNIYGQLGDGTTTNSTTPIAVSGGLTFGAVSGGNLHSCALTPRGVAYCWGHNAYGELGNGTTSATDVPVPVAP